jgi:sensor histidine kinase YesM
VEVFARRRLDLLELEVRDDGCGLPRDDSSGAPGWREGVGLQNTSARLKHLYGDAYRFSVRPRVSGGTIVAIQIPFTPVATLHVARAGTLPMSVERERETA